MQDMKWSYSVSLMQVGTIKMAAEIVECSEVDADLVLCSGRSMINIISIGDFSNAGCKKSRTC